MSKNSNFIAHFKLYYYYPIFWRCITTSIIIIITTNIAFPNGHNVAHAEYYTSMDMLQKLRHVERGLLQTFRQYIQDREREIENYESFIEGIEFEHSKAKEDLEDYLGNPINAFMLIKRLVTDWSDLRAFINESFAHENFHQNIEKLKSELQIPDESELKGAVSGLGRLQRVYNLSVQDLAEGKVYRIQTNSKLTWHDCFEIGTNLFDLKEYPFALTWFETTLRQLKKSQSDKDDAYQRRFEIETLEYLALTANEMGNPEKAVEYIDKIIQLNPDHHTKDMRTYLMNSPSRLLKPFQYENKTWFNNYTRLCRGIQFPQKIFQRLKCRVETRGNPHLVLAPLKVEEMYEDPPINLYHNVLSDIQINQIIQEAEGHMERSTVIAANGSVPFSGRTSQQAWLDYKSPVMKYIYRLVSYITGLDLLSSEVMQVANYGIGGVYEPHHDYFGPEYRGVWFENDRIATNMFYLSDVKQGGYTVFPVIDVFSRPVKGSMVSWYNLHKSLDEDFRTLHAGCPVVTGSKRIGNVWVHTKLQEFRRPCGLVNDKIEIHIKK